MFISNRGNLDCKWWLVDQQRVDVIEQGGGKLHAGLSLLWEEDTIFYFGKQHCPFNSTTRVSIQTAMKLDTSWDNYLSFWVSCITCLHGAVDRGSDK